VNIRIFYDEVSFRIKNWKKIKELIQKVISKEGIISGDLSFIITGDIVLKEINKEFLKHNYYTDVICFNYGENGNIKGEIYISIETVKRNAKNYKVSYSNELLRVLIHGVLHLCGYEDCNLEKRGEMRKLEDFWLSIYFKT
jgi:probable rRNA maturation factor